MSPADRQFEALIVGGGVAALEAALALHDIAPDLVHTSLLEPDAEFSYRPTRVGEPFARKPSHRYPWGPIAADLGLRRYVDTLSWVDPRRRRVHTGAKHELEYDALLLCLGARQSVALRHAITIDPAHLDEQLHGIVQDLEGDWIRRLAFIIPPGGAWPLPMYELALMSAERAYEMNIDASVTLITPEPAPLGIFGQIASDAVRRLLDERKIVAITSAHCSTQGPGRLTVHPDGREFTVDRILTLPELHATAVPGVHHSAARGFLTIDNHARVVGMDRIFAAGDITDFPTKHGGVACQQADAAAQSIANLAGAPIDPHPLRPVLNGLLWTGREPLYLRARVAGTTGIESEASFTPLWDPPTKIHAKYLAPYLEARARDDATLAGRS